MAEQIQYEVSLKDLASGKLQTMEEHAGNFENKLHHIGKTAVEVGTALGVAFAAFKGIEFLKESKEEYEKIKFSISQVKAGLESTKGVAGLTFEELEKSAKEASHEMEFSKAQVMSMQSVLLTFPAVTKETFGDASQAIFDMSTRLGNDLNSTAIQVGKALQDPIRGITALHRAGVNFSEAQKKMIEKLVETGHAAKAQALILKELQTEFAGSAKAAAESDTSLQFKKSVEELNETVGQFVDKLAEVVMPILTSFVDAIKDAAEWLGKLPDLYKENKKWIDPLVGSIIAMTAAYEGYIIWSKRAAVWSAIKTVLFGIETGVIYALGTAIEFVNALFVSSPIGWIIIAVGALVAVIIYCWQHFEKFRAVIRGIWETIKAFAYFIYVVPIKAFYELGLAIANIFHPKEMMKHLEAAKEAVYNGAVDIVTAFNKGYNDSLDNHETHGMVTLYQKADTIKGKGKGDKPEGTKSIGDKASGSKVTTINIKIGSLVSGLHFNVTNVKESLHKIREEVTQTLLSAVNDSQIVAGV